MHQQKEFLFKGKMPANFEKVTYTTSPVSFTIYLREDENYKKIKRYLKNYAFHADSSSKAPRNFKVEFDKSCKSITFKNDVRQAAKILSSYKVLTEEAQNEIVKLLNSHSVRNQEKNSFFGYIVRNIKDMSLIRREEKSPLLVQKT